MIYHNLDPERPRRFGDLLRWRAERRHLSPPPPELAGVPATSPNDGSALRTGKATLTWIGHASIVIQLDGCTILCDPVWSNKISTVVPRLSQPGLALEHVPEPDLVVISHNHYDHLDMPTLRRLGKRVPLLVPAGLRQYMRSRGFQRVHELSWWETTRLGGIDITFVPAQHWSRRLLWDTNRSWWGGYVFEGSKRIYFAGDTGYFSGFPQIASRFPELDWAILPIGAYDPGWFMQPVHMAPEEAGKAFTVLGARRMLPIHYGTFKLSDEPIGEPPVRLRTWWDAQSLAPDRLWLPEAGETRQIE